MVSMMGGDGGGHPPDQMEGTIFRWGEAPPIPPIMDGPNFLVYSRMFETIIMSGTFPTWRRPIGGLFSKLFSIIRKFQGGDKILDGGGQLFRPRGGTRPRWGGTDFLRVVFPPPIMGNPAPY